MAKQRKVEIQDATAAELRKFATDYQGLPDITPSMNKQAVLAKLSLVWAESWIFTTDEAPAEAAPTKLSALECLPDKVTVMIQITDQPGGKDRIPLAVNGIALLVERGIAQALPWRYFEVLRNSIAHHYDTKEDGSMDPVARQVAMYPFQIMTPGVMMNTPAPPEKLAA